VQCRPLNRPSFGRRKPPAARRSKYLDGGQTRVAPSLGESIQGREEVSICIENFDENYRAGVVRVLHEPPCGGEIRDLLF
jgi:hypothetical protein